MIALRSQYLRKFSPHEYWTLAILHKFRQQVNTLSFCGNIIEMIYLVFLNLFKGENCWTSEVAQKNTHLLSTLLNYSAEKTYKEKLFNVYYL
jgi:hypothetical protein